MEKDMQQGWIKIYRQIQKNEIWTDGEPFDRRSAFIDLLLSVNHEDKIITFNGQETEVKAGQTITSIRNLAKRWNWTEKKVRVFLDFLEKKDMIERQADRQKTILTIKNYSAYQGHTKGHTEGHTIGHTESRIKSIKIKNPGHTEGQQTRNKEIKKNNNIYTQKENAKKVVELYQQLCPSLPQITKLTEARIRSINARLKEYTEEEIAEAFRKAEASAFLRGETGTWRASFDWMMKPSNLPKIIEGNYDDKKKQEEKIRTSKYDFKALQKFVEDN